MAAILFHEPVFATIVESGDKLYFYDVGTTTDLTVYLDAALSTSASQPLVADANGRFPPIYIDSTGNPPKVALFDSLDVQKWTVDEYPIEDLAAIQSGLAQLQLDMEAAEGDILGAESDIMALEEDVADHETRIEALESDEGVGNIGKGARVRRAATQSAPSGDTTVTMDTTDFDDADISVSNMLTVPADTSRASVAAYVPLTYTHNGVFTARLRKNNSNFAGQPVVTYHVSDNPTTLRFNLSTGVLNVNPGDTFQIQVSHNGSTCTIEAGAWISLLINK